MELDMHYYAVYRLACLAGFNGDDAETIAYASQYVDDSTEGEAVEPHPGQHFDTVRTAHYNLGAFDWNVQKKIYMPFHFLPQKNRRKNVKSFSYVTQPSTGDNSELAMQLIDEALKDNDPQLRLIRLGVALHTLADTFSHFNFSGRHNEENKVDEISCDSKPKGWLWWVKIIKSWLGKVPPKIGHAEAYSFPDFPFLKWHYKNKDGKLIDRNNADYFTDAVGFIYSVLVKACTGALIGDLGKDYPEELKKIKTLLLEDGDKKTRCRNWQSYTNAPPYDKTKWRGQALEGNLEWDAMSESLFLAHVVTLKAKHAFDDSKWADFHRAAFKQRSLVIDWLN